MLSPGWALWRGEKHGENERAAHAAARRAACRCVARVVVRSAWSPHERLPPLNARARCARLREVPLYLAGDRACAVVLGTAIRRAKSRSNQGLSAKEVTLN